MKITKRLSPSMLMKARQTEALNVPFGANVFEYSDIGPPLVEDNEILEFLRDEIGVDHVYIRSVDVSSSFWITLQDRIREIISFSPKRQNPSAVFIQVSSDRVFVDFRDESGHTFTSFASRLFNGKLGSGYGTSAISGEDAREHASFAPTKLASSSSKIKQERQTHGDEKDDLIGVSLESKDFLVLLDKIKEIVEKDRTLLDAFQKHALSNVRLDRLPFTRNSVEIADLSDGRAIEDKALGAKSLRPPNGQLYSERNDRGESAPDFMANVYGSAGWLTGEFTRADLRKIDPQAEMALRNWERKNGRAPLNLPTKKERNDRLIAEAERRERPEAVRLHDALRARKRRAKAAKAVGPK